MKNKEQKSKIEIIIYTLILGLTSSFLICLLFSILGRNYWPYNTFLHYSFEPFIDWINTGASIDNPYDAIKLGSGYFPTTYVILKIITIFSKELITFFITYFLVVVTTWLVVFKSLKIKEKSIRILISLVLVFSYPFMYLFDLANVEYIVFAFIGLFLIFFCKKKYMLSAIFLSIAISMKLYPAVFVILFLKEKKYKEFILTAVITITLTICSYLLVGGNSSNFNVFLENFSYFIDTLATKAWGTQFSHSFWIFINDIKILFFNGDIYNLLGNFNITIYTVIIGIVSILLFLYILFIEKEFWKNVTVLVIMMIAFPHLSFDYTLVHLLFPVVLFINAQTKEKETEFYSVAFSLLFLPLNYMHKIFPFNFEGINYPIVFTMGTFVRPLIFISILVCIIYTTLKQKVKEKRIIKNEE